MELIQANQGKHFCKCGCNREITAKQYHNYRGIPNFIKGHSNRGRTHSVQTKNKISETKRQGKNNLFTCLHCKQEFIEEPCKKRKYCSIQCCNNHKIGTHHKEETIQKIRTSNKGPLFNIECLNCRAVFSVSSSRRNTAKFCSGNCHSLFKKGKPNRKHSEALRKLYAEKKIKAWNKGKHMIHSGTFKSGHSPSNKTREKMSETRNRLFEEEKIKVWNKDIIGQDSHAWMDGRSFEPYTLDFNKNFKKIIKERDKCCMLCNLGFKDLYLLKRKIAIHHINYNKLDSFKENCLSLCNKCHGITNHNRPHWTTFFQSMLREQYGYEFTQDQKMIIDFVHNTLV